MGLIAGTGQPGKFKGISLALSGWTGTGTSLFGNGSDINCTAVEFNSIGRPDPDENESQEFETNMRKVKDSIATKGWADYDKAEIFNDAEWQNWKAFMAAKETDATGTMTIGVGTQLFSFKAKISAIDGGDGDAASLDTGFTPTFTLLEVLNA